MKLVLFIICKAIFTFMIFRIFSCVNNPGLFRGMKINMIVYEDVILSNHITWFDTTPPSIVIANVHVDLKL